MRDTITRARLVSASSSLMPGTDGVSEVCVAVAMARDMLAREYVGEPLKERGGDILERG